MTRSLFAAAAVALLLTACATSQPPGPSPTDAAGVSVAAENVAFAPDSVEARVGDTVTWTNADAGVAHTVTSGRPGDVGVPGVREARPAERDGLFDGDLADAGATFAFRFTEPGTYRYFCAIHPSMTGEIVVA